MPYFKISIKISELDEKGKLITKGPNAPFTTYFKYRGVPLIHAIHTQDFTSLGAKPWLCSNRKTAELKKIEVDRALERIKDRLAKDASIIRIFETEVV